MQRGVTAAAPNRLWVADITYCRTMTAWVYAVFIIDAISRRVLGRQLSTSWRTDPDRRPSKWRCGHISAQDKTWPGCGITAIKAVQYVTVRYTQRLAEAGTVTSAGRVQVHLPS
ncbi:Mobile element protein [Micrococcus lylae]|uniref:Mobile element protein n=1 Tax=Micrococcus lylae TaxID=1273 RepID=A0A1R4JWG9_9MICC|nr:Mobile element protein [Micrococcus lylae]